MDHTQGVEDIGFDRPIVILGAPRSGTTFLSFVLKEHPDFALAREPSPIWRYGNENRSDSLRPEHASGRIRHHIRSKFQVFLSKSQKTRLLEKTPQNSLRPDFVEHVLPEARYIHILRNGYESALSIDWYWQNNTKGMQDVRWSQRLSELAPSQYPRYACQFGKRIIGNMIDKPMVVWGPRLPGIREMVKEGQWLEIAALQWRMCVESACHFGRKLDSSRYLEIRLEDMASDSIDQIIDFCDMGGEGADRVRIEFEKTFKLDEALHRVAQAGDEELDTIQRMIEPTMKWLGYPV